MREKTETTSSELHPSKTLHRKKDQRPSSKNGFFRRVITPYRQWRELPHQIRQYPQKSQNQIKKIEEMLIDYRLAIVKSTHIAKNINQRIWHDFQKVKSDNDELHLETHKRALFLHGPKYLYQLLTSWQELMREQEELADTISQAPASLKFYNMMMTYKEMRQQERMDDEHNERRFNEAYNSLELALEYAEEFISKRENDFFKTSKILNLDEARQNWSEKLASINELQKSSKSNIDNVINKINKLKNTIFDAPTKARWIHDIEMRFFRLSDDHELLANMYGKTLIHPDELEETKTIMTEVIPKLWVAGENEQLDHYLKQIETYLNTYETSLQEELAYHERHSPWANFGEGAKDGDEIDMLMSFVRIMINAIETRESHMGDHSATVAKLARNTADILKWSPQELKYLEIAGLLHDVGKIWIPETLLNKPGKLTENEFQVLRLHPVYSAKIVESISALKVVAPWILYHHERWDGKGYPENLYQNDIPLGASIIAVAEAFSAMIFNTLSREPLSIDEALQQVREESGKQFDPDVTDAFILAANNMREELENLKTSGFSFLV